MRRLIKQACIVESLPCAEALILRGFFPIGYGNASLRQDGSMRAYHIPFSPGCRNLYMKLRQRRLPFNGARDTPIKSVLKRICNPYVPHRDIQDEVAELRRLASEVMEQNATASISHSSVAVETSPPPEVLTPVTIETKPEDDGCQDVVPDLGGLRSFINDDNMHWVHGADISHFLGKAIVDSYRYAIGLVSGGHIVFTRATITSKDWVHLAGIDWNDSSFPWGKPRCFDERGMDVRISSIAWVLDSDS